MTTAMQPDDLYGLPLDQFIAERGALAKALRGEKRRDEAAAVAALRKPSVAAWAVNQLVRSQGASVEALFAAGDELRDAQARLLAGGGDGRSLRASNERERAVVDEVVQAARGLLFSDGHELSPAVVERVAATLHAAALDEDAREQVRSGRLERELRHVGLGLGDSADPFAAAPATAPKRGRAPSQPAKPSKPAKASQPGAKAEVPPPARAKKPAAARGSTNSAQERRAARMAQAAAKRRAERAGHALKAAEERRARAAKALEQADAALADARSEAQDALAAHEQAQAALDAL